MVYDQSLIPLINEHLPDQIRVVSLTRVTKSFHSRYYCDERAYEYVMPTYALLAVNNSTSTMLNYRIDGETSCTLHIIFFSISDTTFDQVNKLLQCYVGKHNFHNFTSGRSYKEYGSRRHIMSFEVHINRTRKLRYTVLILRLARNLWLKLIAKRAVILKRWSSLY